jgi:ferredoxin
LGLVENEEGKKSGVCIDNLDDNGSLKSTNLVKKGMYLLTINERDVRYEDFDTILDSLIAIPTNQDISLQFIDPKKVFRGPATLTVLDSRGNTITVQTMKSLNLRSVLQSSNIEVYEGKGKLTNCGGGGSCGLCGVEITDNEFWDPRQDFEARKLRKFSENARLSCNTIIEGDCTIVVQPKPKS